MTKCRICRNTTFKQIIDFGDNPLVNSLLNKEDLKKEEKIYPLVVDQCRNCFLIQTREPINSHAIYTAQDYLYMSSDMPQLSEYFLDYAQDIKDRFLNSGDLVVEIGSNDGVLLKHFPAYRRLGVDPSTNVVIRALLDVPTLSAPFNYHNAKNIAKYWGKAKVIMANNCIAHIDDLHNVMRGIKALLDKNGVFVLECNYWGGMVKNKNYSLIYHDHYSYFTLKNWVDIANQYNLKIIDALITPAQGGSLRAFLSNNTKDEVSSRVEELLKEEQGLNSYETAKRYARECKKEAVKLHDLIEKISQDSVIAGYGAAAKGFSVLKLANITEKHIKFFVDDSPAKQGKYTPITHIPIFSRQEVKDPDYFFITATNYEQIIVDKEQDFLKNGGKFITVDSRIIG